jgi:hypothetical protein
MQALMTDIIRALAYLDHLTFFSASQGFPQIFIKTRISATTMKKLEAYQMVTS